MGPVEARPRSREAAAAIAVTVLFAAAACREPADPMQNKRSEMVERQIAARGIRDTRVLAAMRAVPRHDFVSPAEEASAYDDRPLPIGSGQTISQPYVVAFMAEQLQLKGTEKVLEIGTGSGYSTAILASLAARVYSIEIRPELAQEAKERLEKLGVKNVELRTADGYRGWPEQAPFDAILVTAAPEKVPPPLLEQLSASGRMVIPVGAFYQELKVIHRQGGGYSEKSVLPVRFVPFVGEAEGGPPPPRDPATSR